MYLTLLKYRINLMICRNQIILSEFVESWQVFDHTCFANGIINWVLNGITFVESGGYYGGCNTDIKLHINKGVIGLRVDNINIFNMNNIQINNLLNTGNLGIETEIWGVSTQGNAHQDH